MAVIATADARTVQDRRVFNFQISRDLAGLTLGPPPRAGNAALFTLLSHGSGVLPRGAYWRVCPRTRTHAAARFTAQARFLRHETQSRSGGGATQEKEVDRSGATLGRKGKSVPRRAAP